MMARGAFQATAAPPQSKHPAPSTTNTSSSSSSSGSFHTNSNMASTAEVVRSIKIKTSTLTRLHKEYKYYQAEAEKEHARVEAMKAAGADAHDLKQAENVLAESSMMVPETRQRLEAALADLQSYVDGNAQDAADTEELTAAREALATVQGLLQ